MSTIWCLWRKRKKLLVLDLDHTLIDFTPRAEKVPLYRRIRPYLNEFLTVADQYYDIVIWSATSARTLYKKLNILQLLDQPNYSIWLYLDISHMDWIQTPTGKIGTKPLSLIWSSYSSYNARNTLMIDDNATNFYYNERNGLKIEPYFLENYETDSELMLLTDYIKYLANHCRNISKRDHTAWKTHNH